VPANVAAIEDATARAVAFLASVLNAQASPKHALPK
jgi:hypothetical protein